MATGTAPEAARYDATGEDWPRRAAARLRALPWADIGAAAGMVALWRGALWLFALLASFLGREVYPPATAGDFLGRALLQGEALWHIWIGERGYYFAGGERPSTAAFPPLFALLIQAVAPALPSRVAAGAVVAHVALVAALAYLVALVRLDYDRATALRAVAATLLWPAAFFLGVVSPEATLLLTVTAALYHARRGQWWAAAAWGGLAGLTRGFGLLVALPLLVEYWTQALQGHPAPRRQRLRGVLPLALVPLPFLGFLGYLEWRTGALRAYFLAQAALGRGSLLRPRGPDTLAAGLAWLRGAGPFEPQYPPGIIFATPRPLAFLDLGTLALVAALGAWLLLRARPSYGLFVLAGVAASFFVWGLPGSGRQALALAPAFVALAVWTRHQARAYVAAALGAVLLALTALAYVNGFWAG